MGQTTSSLHARVTLWRVVLVALAMIAFLVLAVSVGVTGVVSLPLGLTASGLLLAGGGAAFLLHALALGHLSGLWPGFVFVSAFSVFHFASLGDIEAGWYAPELAPFAWLLSVVCLLAWMVGYVFGRGRAAFRRPSELAAQLGRQELGPARAMRLARLGAAIFVLGFVTELIIYARLGLGAGWNYLAFKTVMNSRTDIGAVHLLAQMSCTVGMLVAATCTALGRRRVFLGPWLVGLAALYVLNLAYQGDRSELGVFLFPLFLVRHYLVRPFGRAQTLALFVAALLAVSGLKAFRASNEASTVAEKIQDPTWVVNKTADETGHTLDTLVRSLELVPGRYPYFAGESYVDAASRVVPNLLWRRDDAMVSSVWVTEETSERRSAGKGGLGFSIVAEAYINFGALGAPWVLLLIGLAHGAAERVLTRRVLRVELFALFVIAELGLLVHIRNSAVLYIRGTIWMASILLAALSLHWLWERMRRGR